MPKHHFYLYIVASHSRVLYIGVTNDLERRVSEHRHKLIRGFTAMYNVTRLVYFEEFDRISEAIAREKQLKYWRRDWKISLIEKDNLDWSDLSALI